MTPEWETAGGPQLGGPGGGAPWSLFGQILAMEREGSSHVVRPSARALVRALLVLPGASVPVPGFGSSDCRACPAHLVMLPAGLGPGV